MNILSRLTLQRNKLMVGASAFLLALSLGLVGTAMHQVSAADCDSNAIIYCGFTSASQFISDVSNNNSGNGHHDLQAIYESYNLVPSEYKTFVSSAELGTAYKNGDIVVNGQTVAKNTSSIGRSAAVQGSGYFTKIINGVRYYGNVNSKAFASNSIPVMVMFNKQGVMQFAVLTSCGNPISGSLVKPTYSCNTLSKTAVSGQQNTYKFTASASAGNNASIVKYTFNFGDGTSTSVSTSSSSASVTHHYSKAGTYKASVTITVSLPGKQTITATSAPCTTTITVVAPYYSCVELTGAILDSSKFNYSFKATASYGNGATFTGADFDFGDGAKATNVQPNGTTVSTSHQYAAAGNYTITATLHFNVNGAVQSVSCLASITPTQPPTPECKPGVPQGSPLCQCQYNSSLPFNSPECVPPATQLVNTGAGNVIAIFAGVVIAGFFIFRQLLFRRHQVATDHEAIMNIGHHMVSGAQEDHSEEMVKHLSQTPDATRSHPNAANALHHPSYHRSNRFRPGKRGK